MPLAPVVEVSVVLPCPPGSEQNTTAPLRDNSMQYCAIVAFVRVKPGSTKTTGAGFSSDAVSGTYMVTA